MERTEGSHVEGATAAAYDAWTELGLQVVGGRVEDAGDALAEARAAVAGETLLVPLASVSALSVTGADRTAFLHGQLSNDIQGLGVGACSHALQLNARGQIVAEVQVCVRADDVLLAVDDGAGGALVASLERHIVFDEVEVRDTSATVCTFTLQGSRAAAVLARSGVAIPEHGRFAVADVGGAQALIAPRRRAQGAGFDLHVARADARALATHLTAGGAAEGSAGARLAGEAALRLVRVLAGIPSATVDGGGALPQETGLDAAVSYRKGCYLGQEIMARIEARGAVRRALYVVEIGPPGTAEAEADPAGEAPLPMPGTPVEAGGRTVGALGTAVRHPDGGVVGLAVLRTELPPGAPPSVGDRPLTVRARAQQAAGRTTGGAGGGNL